MINPSHLSRRAAVLLVALLGTASSSLSCKARVSGDSAQVKAISYSPSATNVAVLFGNPATGTGYDLPNIENDTGALAKILGDTTNPQGFKVYQKINASTADMLLWTKNAVQALGDDGTFLFYYTGHGEANTGRFWTYPYKLDGSDHFDFTAILAAIRSVRKTPIKRLVVVLDSCFSGAITNKLGLDDTNAGSAATDPAQDAATFANTIVAKASGAAGGAAAAPAGSSSGVYEQLFVISASTAYQESGGSIGAGYASVFTQEFGNTYASLVQSGRKDYTLQQFAAQAQSATYNRSMQLRFNNGAGQTPQFKFVPAVVGTDLLFGSIYASAAATGTGADTGAAKVTPATPSAATGTGTTGTDPTANLGAATAAAADASTGAATGATPTYATCNCQANPVPQGSQGLSDCYLYGWTNNQATLINHGIEGSRDCNSQCSVIWGEMTGNGTCGSVANH